jgi:hypothetical protein
LVKTVPALYPSMVLSVFIRVHLWPSTFCPYSGTSPVASAGQSDVLNPYPVEFAEFGVEGQNLTICPIARGLCKGGIHKAEAGPVLPRKAIHRFQERI